VTATIREVVRSVARLSAPYWTGPGWRRAWFLSTAAVFFAFAEIGAQIALNRWNKTFYDALELRSWDQLTAAATWFLVLAGVATIAAGLSILARLNLQISWRQHLTGLAIGQWLRERAFYRLTIMHSAGFSPEHRVAEDVRLTVEPIVDLIVGFVSAITTLLVFAGVLWSTGGVAIIGGFVVPGFLLWAAIAYAAVVSSLMVTIGNSYAQRIRERSEAEAQFRYELTRVRENAESVALIRGEPGEARSLSQSFATVADRWRAFASRWSQMTAVVSASSLAAPVVPVLLMAPKYLAGDVTLGTVMQAAAAFGMMQSALGWVTTNFARLSELYAAASRVNELFAYIAVATTVESSSNTIGVEVSPDENLHLIDVSLQLHTGRQILTDADLIVKPGEMVLVTGESGTGKSTLVRAIAGLWPWGSGKILLPANAELQFVPQRPYLPLGTLRAAVAYPKAASEVPTNSIVQALELCGLEYLLPRLDEVAPWDRLLSGGEQQRVSFARLLVTRPSIVILDEATSALDETNQARMMELFRTELFSACVISVGHRPSLEPYHSRRIHLVKDQSGAQLFDRRLTLTVWDRMRRALAGLRDSG
jgi:vitamin B12/bleomycin/antimicrobial peptide transport system ATP-binding/permease protein